MGLRKGEVCGSGWCGVLMGGVGRVLRRMLERVCDGSWR